MAAYRLLESGLDKNQVTNRTDEVSDNSADLKQITHGKPPRHPSDVHHSITSLTNTAGGAVDSVS